MEQKDEKDIQVKTKILNDLSAFYNSLSISIQHKTLNNEELKKAFDFFVTYNFENEKKNYDDSDLMSFFSLGWFIYTQLLPFSTS